LAVLAAEMLHRLSVLAILPLQLAELGLILLQPVAQLAAGVGKRPPWGTCWI
jgi:hypothetical protein